MSRLGQSWLALLLTTLCACSTTSQAPAPGDANNKTSALSQANQFAREGLLREAVDAYKKLIAKDPDNIVARRNLGIVLLKAGDPKGAIINLELAIKNFEQNFETNFFLAEAYRAEDKYAEAIYRYKKSLKIKPDETRALKSLAWSYFKIRFYSEAINIATRLQKKAPNDEQALMIFARTQIKLKRENEAIATLKRGLDRASVISKPYFESVIAEAYAAQGKKQAALEMWQQALKTQPLMAGALMGVGRVLLDSGREKEAIDYLERAVRVKPKMTEGHYWLARSLQNSNPERALRYYNAFKKNSANDPEFVELVLDAKKRAASLQNRARPETNSLR
jgi:tetratricopeptide (TPR) repeat protein